MRDLTAVQWRAVAPMLERVRPRTGPISPLHALAVGTWLRTTVMPSACSASLSETSVQCRARPPATSPKIPQPFTKALSPRMISRAASTAS